MTQNKPAPPPVLQLRVVVEAHDFDQAVAFYRDTLGLPEQLAFEGDGDARVVILDAGRATLELSNAAQVRMIDDVETDGRPGPKIRLAFEVTDAVSVTRKLATAGAVVVAEPRLTPWLSVNSRLEGPADLQFTLFQEKEDLAIRSDHPGFGDATGRS